MSLIEAVRDAIGPETELMLEMHGRFSPATAVRLAREMAPFHPAWLEEPVPPENLKALAKVAQKVELPIATGERIHDRIEFREIFEAQAADIIQPDVGHIGGILEARKLAATAETHYMLVAPHNVGGSVLTAASLHLAGCTPNFKILEHFNDFADAEIKKVVKGAPQVDPETAASSCRPRRGSAWSSTPTRRPSSRSSRPGSTCGPRAGRSGPLRGRSAAPRDRSEHRGTVRGGPNTTRVRGVSVPDGAAVVVDGPGGTGSCRTSRCRPGRVRS